MKYVYLMQSLIDPSRRYVGVTGDVEKRLAKHNEGGSPYTAEYRPWQIIAYVAFCDEKRPAEFERYLKTGSGRAFAARHLW